MSTYTWKSWGGRDCRVEAEALSFEYGHVAFWNANDRGRVLVLAVDNANVHDLKIIEGDQ